MDTTIKIFFCPLSVALWVPFVLLGFWWVANGSLQYRKTKFFKPVRLAQKEKE